MRHTAGIAELNGWTQAVADAVQQGIISLEAAKWLAGQSGEYTRKLLVGELVAGKTLDDWADDDHMFDNMVDHHNAFKQGYPQ